MMAYINLVQTHEQLDGPLTDEQNAHLITLIEKRLPPDSQLRADYFSAKKGRKASSQETWDLAMRRLHQRRLHVDEEERELWRPLQGLPLPPRVSSPR
jgi:O-methyltransferase involved in polyketide biosynthesis